MHFICFIVFPNALQNRSIFCDRMITKYAVLFLKVSDAFLSIFIINLINHEGSGGPNISQSPIDLSTTRSTLRERLIAWRKSGALRHVTFCVSQFSQQQEDTQGIA